MGHLTRSSNSSGERRVALNMVDFVLMAQSRCDFGITIRKSFLSPSVYQPDRCLSPRKGMANLFSNARLSCLGV